jgi:hypothetical protein
MLELVFFGEEPLVLDAVRSLVSRPGAATVRGVTLDWKLMDMKSTAASEMDAVLTFVNARPSDPVWDVLHGAFPRVRTEASLTCSRLGIRRASEHTVCLDVGPGPLVIMYGPSRGGDAHEGFSAMLRLAPDHCTVGIPCVGNVFGTCMTAARAMEGMMRALDDISTRGRASSRELSCQYHTDVSEVAYGVLYDQWEIGLQP